VASYSLKGSYSTVQVLSPTLVNDVVYCTIQTIPSGVIASVPVQQREFDTKQTGPQLTNFANAIEQTMSDPRVIAGVGEQTIDPSGLLADNVVFTVQYVSANTAPTGVTAEALVPVSYLDFSDAEIGRASASNVDGIITQVYDSLKSAAGTSTAGTIGTAPPAPPPGPNPSGG
jgi:hypothetical protein